MTKTVSLEADLPKDVILVRIGQLLIRNKLYTYNLLTLATELVTCECIVTMEDLENMCRW